MAATAPHANAPSARERALRWWPAGAALAVAVLTWPVYTLAPTTGLDPSWQIGLHLAADERMEWGTDVVFTYGPLGFLDVPQLVGHAGLTAAAWVWALALQFLVALGIILGARRSFPWPVGVALAVLVGLLAFDHQEHLALVAFIWAAFAVQGLIGERLGRALVPLAGVVCALALLLKFNVAVLVLTLAVIAVPFLPPHGVRSLTRFATALVVAFLALWGASVGSPAAIPDWLRGSVEVASGFSAGMPLEDPARGWEYPAFFLIVAGLAFLAWQWGPALPRRRALALGAVLAALVAVYYKHGFVRHDFEHSSYTFVVLLAVPAAIVWRGRAGMAAGLGLIGACAAVALGVYAQAERPALADLFDPHERAGRLVEQAEILARPGRRDDVRAEARERMAATLEVPDEMLAAVGDDPVHIDPYEISVAWTYGLRWRPLPTLQAYVSYTNALDERAAERLASDEAPRWVLREEVGRLDGRTRETESPAAQVALVCNYTERLSGPRWRLLERTPGRCSPERPLPGVERPAGAAVPVPAPAGDDVMVVARLDVPIPLRARLKALVHKPARLPLLVLNDDYGARIARASAEGPVLVRAAATTGFSEYAGGFAAGTLRLLDAPSPVGARFAAIRVAPPDQPSRAVGGG